MPSSYSFTYLPDAQEEGPERLDAASSRSKKMRIDKFLAQSLPEHSRSYIQNLLRQGYVIVNGDIVTDANDKLLSGTTVTITLPDAEDPAPQPENIPLDILYEDDDIVVVDKPAGITVHPGAGQRHGTLVNALLYHCGASLSGINGVKRPGIVIALIRAPRGYSLLRKTTRRIKGWRNSFYKMRPVNARSNALMMRSFGGCLLPYTA